MKLARLFGIAALSLPFITFACGGKDDDAADNDTDSSDGLGGSGGEDGGSTAVACRSDKACTPLDLVCDTDRSVCVECLSENDCTGDALCQAGTCFEITPCDSSKDCGSDQVCDDALGYCVECVGTGDCADGQICADTVCHEGCDSSKDCAANDQVCGDGGYCVDCQGNNDCDDGSFCSNNVCVASICTPGETSCAADDLLTCNTDGWAYDSVACADGCAVEDDVAACVGEEPGQCAGATANPCSSIPQFVGTQTVDGDPEDFCDIPYKLMNPANAAIVGGPTGAYVDGATIDSDSEATIRVAWSADALHVHIHVVDPLLRTVAPNLEYNGDNVQLFIQAAQPYGGSVLHSGGFEEISSQDLASEPQQIFLTPESEIESASSRFVVTTYAPGSGYLWATRNTSDGYDIELEYPWPVAVAPLAAGDVIGFDIMVGVDDQEAAGARQFEYGLHLDTTSGLPGCADQTRDAMWCDNGSWCAPTLAE